jgi:ATP-binding cassette subfamily B protein/subfamily B ATP-binding cassette protein MsbA
VIGILRLVAPYLASYWRSIALALVAIAVDIATALATPVPIQLAVDRIVRHGARHGPLAAISWASLVRLVPYAVVLVLIALAAGASAYLHQRETARLAQNVTTDLRRDLFSHLQRLSLSFHHGADTRVGELQLRLSGDLQALQDLFASGVSSSITSWATALGMLALLFWVDRSIGLVVSAASVPIFLLARHYRIRIKQATRLARRQEGRVTALVAELLSSAKLVQAFGREEYESVHLQEEVAAGLDYGFKAAEYQARVQLLVVVAASAVTAVAFLLGAVRALDGAITIGQLTLVLAYSRGAVGSLRQAAKLPAQAQKAAVAAERLRDLLTRQPAVREPRRPRPLPRAPYSITFEHVTFGYVEGRPVIHDLTWYVPERSAVAVVGATGAGKSTLMALVSRFYDPWQGAVRLGEVDLRQVSRRDLRSQLTLVLQESLLLRDTVWNNIAYGMPSASRAKVLQAAELAGVTSFVGNLDDGFNTVVSERGATLSGGQKQCIAIARALLRDTPVVLMDEPTSSLDAATERLVVQGLYRLMAGRTAIIISHHFRTVRYVDQVAVIEGGHLVEAGPPADLLQAGGSFARLAALQAFSLPHTITVPSRL